MNLKYIISAFVLVLSSLVQAQNPVIVDEIIAKVDDNIILKSEIERTYLDAVANGNDPANLKCQILSSMVQNKLMVAHSEIDSVTVSDEQVSMELNRRIDIILNQVGGNEEMILEYYGKTLEDIRVELREQVREQMIVNAMQQHITAAITVTPSETRRFFRKIPSDSLPYYDMQVTVAQITENVEAGEEEKNKIINELIELRKQVVNGADFHELARKNSEGPSAPNGGRLGRASRGSMVPAYEAAALAMKPGDISMPVESEFGFHLIKLHERQGNEYVSSHILMRAKPSEDDFKRTANYLDSLATLIRNDSFSFEFIAREYSSDEMTSGSGGYFTDMSGAQSISISDVEPEIYFAIDTMKVGSISAPLEYQKRDGSPAMRIIYFKDKKDPHQANLEDDWRRVQDAALAEKKNRILTEWFLDAQGDIFISIDKEYEKCRILN